MRAVLYLLVACVFAVSHRNQANDIYSILGYVQECVSNKISPVQCQLEATLANPDLEDNYAFQSHLFDELYTYTSYISTPEQIAAIEAYMKRHGI